MPDCDESCEDAAVIVPAEMFFNWFVMCVSLVCCAAKNAGGRNLYSAHRLDSLKGVPIRTVASGCMACHSVVISTDGKVYSWGLSFRV